MNFYNAAYSFSELLPALSPPLQLNQKVLHNFASSLWVTDVASCPSQILIMVHVVPYNNTIVDAMAALDFLNVVDSRVILVSSIGVLTTGTNSRTVSPEQEWDGTARQAYEGQQCRRPLVTEAIVHLRRK